MSRKKDGNLATAPSTNARRRFVPLDRLSPYTNGKLLNVVIETSKGSQCKLDYDAALGTFKLGAILPEGSTFPFNFGFIPGTLADDGDPLDVLVLIDFPLSPGTVVCSRLIGVIRGDQTERDGETDENDRLIAISPESILYENVKKLSELPEEVVHQVQEFFVNYNAQRGKKFAPKGQYGPKKAKECFERARDKFRRSRR